MNEVKVSSPYDVIIQQQIDIIASRQKDILEGKEDVTDTDLHNAIAQLQNIKACTPSQSPFDSNVFGGYGAIGGSIGSVSRLKDGLKHLGEI